MKHSDYITHIDNKEDDPYLKWKLKPVNMRLFKTSPEYKAIILGQCAYLKMLVLTKMDGYKKPHGMSAANAGLAFNIIAICRNREKKDEYAEVMINPVISNPSGGIIDSLSNCGSITLPHPIAIKRHEFIDLYFFDEKGEEHTIKKCGREQGGFTIQHEVDHNNGILITHRTTGQSLYEDRIIARF